MVELAKSFGLSEDFGNTGAYDHLLGNLQLEYLSDPSNAQSTAAMEWTVNRDQTNADQGTLWVLLSPLFHQF